MSELKSYAVWDANTRWFHWINALCVIALAVVGFVILHASDLEISNAGKVTLKTVHAWIGYVFVFNLLWRFAWAFLGNRYARWRSILPGERVFPRGTQLCRGLHSRSTGAVSGAQPGRAFGYSRAVSPNLYSGHHRPGPGGY